MHIAADRAARAAGAIVLLSALLAGAMVLWVTRSGIAVTGDSAWYINMARWIHSDGAAVSVAQVASRTGHAHYPPGYPLLLAYGSGDDKAIFETARWVNALAIAVSALLVAANVWVTSGSATRAALATALFVLAADTWQTHLHLWSESSFGVLMLASLLFGTIYIQRRQSLHWLCLAALLAGLGVLIRYAGVALILSTLVALFLAPRYNTGWRRRIGECALYGIIASLPLAAWLVWYSAHGPSEVAAAARDVGFGAVGWVRLNAALRSIGEWIAYGIHADGLIFAIGIVTLAGALGMLWWTIGRARGDGSNVRRAALPLAYLLVYPAFLVTSVSFFDHATPFDRRILAPLHVAAILAFATLVPAPDRRWGLAAIGLLLAAQAGSAIWNLSGIREAGLGYSSLAWQRQEIIQYTRALPPGTTLITNNVQAVELAARRNAVSLPRIDKLADPNDPVVNQREIERLKRQLTDGSYLIMIKWHQDRQYTSLDRLSQTFTLRRVRHFPTGDVYVIDRPELRVAAN